MSETWRRGRHSGHNLYLQTGAEPSRDDRQIGVMFDPAHAAAAVKAVNSAGLDSERVGRALRAVIADLDYDLHKGIERDEETGEDTYHETVAAFIAAYEKGANDG